MRILWLLLFSSLSIANACNEQTFTKIDTKTHILVASLRKVLQQQIEQKLLSRSYNAGQKRKKLRDMLVDGFFEVGFPPFSKS